MHFASARNWLNDPNGLVFHDGRYHLFFQYNPEGDSHGNMSWGHASGTDLVHWEEHPVALRYTDEHEIYSGSAVVDVRNTSGLGSVGEPPLVAVYTLSSSRSAHQAQGIASSRDGGMTWTPFEGNPVLDRGTGAFRDPKVFRYSGPAGEYWVMAAVEADEHRVLFYRSDDLIRWSPLSAYGPQGATGGVWECPDLFPLPVDGDPARTRWVLLISLNPGGIAGGSGTQYVIGSFDGVRFTPDEPAPPSSPLGAESGFDELLACDWLDHGRDCYAGVTFSGLPDEERTLIAWMDNWDYAKDMPVDPAAPQRGRMTLARRLALQTRGDRVRLVQTPIGPETLVTAQVVAAQEEALTVPPEQPLAQELAPQARLRVRLRAGAGASAELRFEGPAGTPAVLRFAEGGLSLDRRGGAAGLPAAFASVERMPLASGDVLDAEIWLDEGSIEIFADGGASVLTDRIGSGVSRVVLAAVAGPVDVEEWTIAAPASRYAGAAEGMSA